MALSAAWLANPWLVWGLGPYIASVVGFLVPTLLLEALLATGWLQSANIRYASSNHKPRETLLADTWKRVSFRKQVKGSLKFILGFPTINTCIGSAVVNQLLGRTASSWWPQTPAHALLQFVAAAVVNDFGLYVGHRIQHEVPYLWKNYHSKHHSIDTPTPWSTLFIHPVDATLQGGLPLLVASILVRATPAVMYLFVAARLAENALNHSGLDSALINALTLKSLPFRAQIAFHDAHHKYSNHLGNAKNYGESFWIWDALFGTCSGLTGSAVKQTGKQA